MGFEDMGASRTANGPLVSARNSQGLLALWTANFNLDRLDFIWLRQDHVVVLFLRFLNSRRFGFHTKLVAAIGTANGS